jgi:hypothetical protein
MGNASSVPPASVEFLSQIAGGQPIPLQDPTWKSLVAFPTSLASYDPMDVQGHIRPHTASLGKPPSLISDVPPRFLPLYIIASLSSSLQYVGAPIDYPLLFCSVPQFPDS